MKVKIKTEEIIELNGVKKREFPKYTTQLMNLASQNAQATRPKVLGQLSDLIQMFSGETIHDWKDFYYENHPEAIKESAKKVWRMVVKLKKAIKKIDKTLIESWVEDLVINKTYCGLNFQEAILAKVAEQKETDYRLATPEEESKNIDGYIGNTPVSIKPSTYKRDKSKITIDIPIIFYTKRKDGVTIEHKL